MNQRAAFFFFVFCAVLFFLQGSHNISRAQNTVQFAKATEHFDAIIVPGIPYKDPALEIIFKARILWAKYLFDNGVADNIIFSGGAVYNPYVEGIIMKTYADSLGIPPAHTFSEVQAEHSTENIYYSLLMARQMGFRKVAVATDHYQAIIIKKFMDKNCPDVKLILIEFKKINLIAAPWPEIDPSAACVDDFVSLVEREDRIKRFKGTLGMNINYDEGDTLNYPQRRSLFSLAGLSSFR
ncbi:MAG: YdcF family protein [Bacteroidia bacterium]|jgi:uncharacterized SAM-binding protein YcdF (DUF218 family)